MNAYAERVFKDLQSRFPWEKEFLQAVREVFESVSPVLDREPKYERYSILERVIDPERTVSFRVPWKDDANRIHVNRGYRVEFNSALGPYKGGLRFHSTVTLSGLKFLGFEQIFKNSLTGLPMGGGKGGSDFDPRGRSDDEVERFCQSFMSELYRHIGADTDVPAGDIGVGGREIGYLFGQYKRLKNVFEGVLTGKGMHWGGSNLRPEATGFGVVYFTQEMLKTRGETLEGKRVAISGFGNVAWGAAIKVNELGGKVITISGPDGFVYDPDGISGDKIEYMLQMRASGHDRVEDFADEFGVEFYPGRRPWSIKCDVALPCAIQNELDEADARQLVANGAICVCEGANMPTTPEAIEVIQQAGLLYSPGKASNAGGVACSGLEMSQNSMRLRWTREEVDQRLHQIMVDIHKSCLDAAERYGHPGNYMVGANIAGFLKVANAMIEQGLV